MPESKLLLDKTHVHECARAHTHPFLYHDSICLFGIRQDKDLDKDDTNNTQTQKV